MDKIIGKKLKMGQIFRDDKVLPVTFIEMTEGDDVIELKEGDKVKVTGITKGRGFQGVVKRHGFHGGPKTHGQKHSHRAPGSIGATGPQRVMPGTKMAGRMGNDKKTIKNLRVVTFDKGRRLLLLRGAVPGNRGGKIIIAPLS